MRARLTAPLTLLALFAAAAFAHTHADTDQAAPASAGRTTVVLLGTGTPNADPERWGPAVAIVVDDQAYLVDAGVGVVRRAAATNIAALRPTGLRRVFITHLHSDHTLGLPDLMFSPWVLERPSSLDIYGPPGITAMARHLEAAWQEDIAIRRDGGEPKHPGGYQAVTHEIKAGRIYEDTKVKIDAIPVAHGAWKDAFGFRFQTPDRVIVISGDTSPTTALADACQGCDVLVHEVYSAVRFQTRPPEWQTYHSAFHTSTTQLAAIAGQAKPRLLVLYHQLFWGATGADLEREIAQAGYSGKVISARDLDVF
jgi:ribonuclease BN (tRNA processing enzyme)